MGKVGKSRPCWNHFTKTLVKRDLEWLSKIGGTKNGVKVPDLQKKKSQLCSLKIDNKVEPVAKS